MEVVASIAHSGKTLHLRPGDYDTGDDFKAALSHESSIPPQHIIALTDEGHPLKLDKVPAARNLFIYDGRLFRSATSGRGPPKVEITVPTPKPYAPTNPPNRIDDAKSLDSWQELFRSRQAWVESVVDDCTAMAQSADGRYTEMNAMTSCIDIAILNAENILGPQKNKLDDALAWAAKTQTEHNMLVTRWEAYLSLARSIPINVGIAEFMTDKNMSVKSRMGRPLTLEDLLDLDVVKKTGRQAPQALRKFNQRVNDLKTFGTRTFQSFQDLEEDFNQLMRRSALGRIGDPSQLLEDIKAVAKTVRADFQATLELSISARDLAQASKMAARHTERLLPTIRERAMDMDQLLQYATKARNAIAVQVIDWMASITDCTAHYTQLKAQIDDISKDADYATFDYLRLIQQAPFIYASFAVEAIRRRTWYDNLEEDASAVAEDVAQFQNEETERRKKWSRSVEHIYSPQALASSSGAPVMEINMLGREKQWPTVTKQEVLDFHETLQRQKAEPAVIKDVGKLIEGMDKPTKLQLKRIKAFKNGSIHESALGRSALLLRGDNELVRALQDDKQRLESKLKTAESRVKRLENVLHTQSTSSIPSFQSFQTLVQQSNQHVPANNGALGLLPNATHKRRAPSTDLPEDVLQRMKQLEGELSAQKAELERVSAQLEEVNSTKNDLLKNMEAQNKQSMEERKSLVDEIKQLKYEIDENEYKIENVDESREHAKASYDEQIQILQDQIAKLTKDRSDDALKAEGQVEFLRKEGKVQREQIEQLERKLQAGQDAQRTASKHLESINQTAQGQLQALTDVHLRLAPNEKVPDDHNDLIESVTNKCSSLLEKIHNVEGDMSVTRSELEEAHNLAKDIRAEKAQIEESLASEESTARQLRESLGEETARAGALESELEESRKQLSDLRAKISDGETGSDSLRKKLEEEEKKITSMAESLASKQSLVGSLEEELRLFKDKLQESQAKLGIMNGRFMLRTEQAKDLTQKLYTQNDRLCRLLERMGFSIARTDGTMTLQRIPRAERSTIQNESVMDPEVSTRKSGTLPQSPDSSDLELLYWMNHADQATETEKYQAFMSELGAFDMDAFTEAVYKRVKDIEHLARKLQRDARAYRDRAHAYQKAGHDKIAFKNFKVGDLALFLPTRNGDGAWAAFNVGHPHYFLREQEQHELRGKDWLLARIHRIQEHVVDLSKTLPGPDGAAPPDPADAGPGNGNPFDLNDGLRWWLIDANEDQVGAPATPGLGKATVAANKVDAVAEKSHARNTSSGSKALGLVNRPSGIDGVSKTLSKSLESRRSSTSSRRALPFLGGNSKGSALASEANSVRATASPDAVAAAESSSAANGEAQGQQQDRSCNTAATAAGKEEEQQQQDGSSQAPEVRLQPGPLDNLLGP